jgi:alginate O-acetyltransferase complex protein AlgI
VTGATTAVFLASGLVHDLVISVPVRGGYGRPTFYFAFQLAGLLIERSHPLRGLFARRSNLGCLFTFTILVAPLPLLFHEPFVRTAILPFLNAIGGLS